MTATMVRNYRHLEGHHVSVTLVDGSRLDDCELVSTGRGRHNQTVWLHDGQDDRMVRAGDVVDMWEII